MKIIHSKFNIFNLFWKLMNNKGKQMIQTKRITKVKSTKQSSKPNNPWLNKLWKNIKHLKDSTKNISNKCKWNLKKLKNYANNCKKIILKWKLNFKTKRINLKWKEISSKFRKSIKAKCRALKDNYQHIKPLRIAH